MQSRVERVSNGRHRSPSWHSIAVVALALALAACGGGGSSGTSPSGGGTGSGNPPPPPPPPSGRATLVVTVVDAFGFPVPAADVEHYLASDRSLVSGQTDSEGAVTLDVPAGAGQVGAVSIFGGLVTAIDLAPKAREELRLALVPWAGPNFAVLGAEVVPGSVAADGRRLELRIQMAGSAELNPVIGITFRSPRECTARDGDALAALGPKCVDKGDGTDRGWQRTGEVEVGELTTATGVPAGPVLVLLDRSQRAGEYDEPEELLFAAKLLAANLLDDHPITVGAFAGDGGSSGTASPLPQKPVTYLPVENPGWITDRVAAFEALESLRGLAGGSPALAAAIDSGVDFLLSRTGASDRPALVVLTAGGSEGCSFGTAPGPDAASQCGAIRAAVDHARHAGVTLWLVGPGDNWYGWGTSPVSLISVAGVSRARWAPAQIEGLAFGASELVRSALSGALALREVRFTISTDEAGSFAPGVEIGGDVWYDDGDFGFRSQTYPFRATVPAVGSSRAASASAALRRRQVLDGFADSGVAAPPALPGSGLKGE